MEVQLECVCGLSYFTSKNGRPKSPIHIYFDFVETMQLIEKMQ
jgi:hypothetical protein